MSVFFVLLYFFDFIFFGHETLNAGLLKNYICLQVNNFVFGLLIGQQLATDNRTGGGHCWRCVFGRWRWRPPLPYCRLSSALLAAVSRPVLSSALCIRVLFRNEPLCMGIMWDIWAFAYASTAKVKACTPPPSQPPAPFITREHRPQLSSHNKPSLRSPRWAWTFHLVLHTVNTLTKVKTDFWLPSSTPSKQRQEETKDFGASNSEPEVVSKGKGLKLDLQHWCWLPCYTWSPFNNQ